jgi:MFS superfamily sulfate permease-like transporter
MLWLARVARLGFLADFLSRTVLLGFLTGVGIQVAAGQVASMLGIPKQTSSVPFFNGTLIEFGKTLGHVGEASWQTTLVAACVIAVLVLLNRLTRSVPAGLVAVVGAIGLSWALDLGAHGVATLGPVPSGLPGVGFPSGVSWRDAQHVLPTAASMFVVILAQSAATSRAFAVKYGERFKESTDLLGLGAANLAAGLTGAYVVNGSPTKTEIVDEARSRTQVAQLTTAAAVAAVLLFLTAPLKHLPDAALAAVVFAIGLKLIALRPLRRVHRVRRDEFWVAVLTAAVVVVIGVEQGIVLAVVVSLIVHVKRHYAPHDAVVTFGADGRLRLAPPASGTVTEPGLVIYRFAVGIFYANAQRLSDEMLGLAAGARWLVLAADAIDDVDYTGGQTLLEVADELAARGVVFAVAGAAETVRRQLDRFGLTAKIGARRYFDTPAAAREAFHRAA